VCQAANALTALGVQARDRVTIYMPMIPEAVVAMLACARIGATHSVVFGGFSVDASQGPHPGPGRDARHYGGRWLPPRCAVAAEAHGGRGRRPVPDRPQRRRGPAHRQEVAWTEGRDLWWHDTVEQASPEHTAEPFDAEHPLYILYTSGTTAKPKGILHTTGGYLTQVSWTHHAVFDLKPDTDVYWCTADIGWVTGHSYIVYGPLSNGATQVMYEGTPDTPHRGRFWELIEKYGITILYTAPTAIRTFAKWGDDIPAQFNLGSLRLLGSVGEPINPEAWMWYREHIGGNRCPIVDTWWQTETGGIMISPLPGVTPCKPGSAMRPLPGITADVVDDAGNSVPNGGGGYLVVRDPWPSMLRTIWGDDQRFIETYWSRFAGMYFPGDGAKRDEDGDLWLLGRVDDVMLVSGHNISTTEVESALVSHPKVAESAVVGATDPTTGQAIVAFVILRGGVLGENEEGDALVKELRDHVAKTLGAIAKPRQIMLVPELPKTRSGKIMRRLLRDVAENRSLGDVTTLQDSSVMDLISDGLKTSTTTED
jgi:acetyl-CoA synthetase